MQFGRYQPVLRVNIYTDLLRATRVRRGSDPSGRLLLRRSAVATTRQEADDWKGIDTSLTHPQPIYSTVSTPNGYRLRMNVSLFQCESKPWISESNC